MKPTRLVAFSHKQKSTATGSSARNAKPRTPQKAKLTQHQNQKHTQPEVAPGSRPVPPGTLRKHGEPFFPDQAPAPSFTFGNSPLRLHPDLSRPRRGRESCCVKSECITNALWHLATDLLNQTGVDPANVSARSLTALLCANVDATTIKLIGGGNPTR